MASHESFFSANGDAQPENTGSNPTEDGPQPITTGGSEQQAPHDESAQEKPSGKRREPKEEGGRGGGSGIIFLLVLLVVTFLFITFYDRGWRTGTKVDFGFFLNELKDDNIKSVKIQNNKISGKWKKVPKSPDPKVVMEDEFHTVFAPEIDSGFLISELSERGISTKIDDTHVSVAMQVLLWSSPIFIVAIIFYIMMRRSADPMSSGMFGNFVRSPAKQFRMSEQRTTFDDVAGMEQAKNELQEIVEYLKNPAKFQRLGAQIPKGVLLMGSPGTGKTLLARATAGEADVPFFSVNGSEFIQMFVGVGASRVRDLFKQAKDNAPCLVFIDEIDAVGRVRGAGMGGGHDEREQTLNQILSEMDGFQQNEAIIVIAATNRPDVLDRALTRPGRFDRHISVDLPSKKGRVGILKVHSRKVPLADDVDLEKVAASTIGFSGAELRNLVNEAALCASRTSKSVVAMEDFETAADRILMGAEREEVLSDHEKRMTAYHEAGHALIAWLLPELDPVHKVTIVPRGRALGVTQLRPKEERHSVGEKKLHSQLAMWLGGRAAEKMIFDEYTAGAQQDLKQATDVARKMVAFWGMSERIGPVAFHHAHEDPFLGRDYQEQRDFSDATAHVIDEEVQRVLDQAAQNATRILTEHKEMLVKLSETLIKREILSNEEIEELLGERPDFKPIGEPSRNGDGHEKEETAEVESSSEAT